MKISILRGSCSASMTRGLEFGTNLSDKKKREGPQFCSQTHPKWCCAPNHLSSSQIASLCGVLEWTSRLEAQNGLQGHLEMPGLRQPSGTGMNHEFKPTVTVWEQTWRCALPCLLHCSFETLTARAACPLDPGTVTSTKPLASPAYSEGSLLTTRCARGPVLSYRWVCST